MKDLLRISWDHQSQYQDVKIQQNVDSFQSIPDGCLILPRVSCNLRVSRQRISIGVFASKHTDGLCERLRRKRSDERPGGPAIVANDCYLISRRHALVCFELVTRW